MARGYGSSNAPCRHGACPCLVQTRIKRACTRRNANRDAAARGDFAADIGGIRNWRADGGDALLIESMHNRWYRATCFGRCDDLRFADGIGFVTAPSGELDRFSSILVNRRECAFPTFDTALAPAEQHRNEQSPGHETPRCRS